MQDELVYTRVGDAGLSTSRIEIQSWQFVVSNIAKGDVPWFFPVGTRLATPSTDHNWRTRTRTSEMCSQHISA